MVVYVSERMALLRKDWVYRVGLCNHVLCVVYLCDMIYQTQIALNREIYSDWFVNDSSPCKMLRLV